MANPEKLIPRVVTIASSDPCGGAGVQADLKAFAGSGVYGASVITCITAQNTLGVAAIQPLGLDIIKAQIDSVLDDLRPRVIKTGMLYSAEIIKLVAEEINEYKNSFDINPDELSLKVVIDPVLTATTGGKLTENSVTDGQQDRFIDALKTLLFPLATVITPNLPEAERILGRRINTEAELLDACKDMYKFGSEFVLLKGGHVPNEEEMISKSSDVVDLLYDGQFRKYYAERIQLENASDIHGTGCAYASFIAGYLAWGHDVPTAIELAKKKITAGIRNSIKIGSGIPVVDSSGGAYLDSERYRVKTKLTAAVEELSEILEPRLIPEVGINIGYALSSAQDADDICALTGRFVRVGKSVGTLGRLEFGASKHVARIILSAKKADNRYQCGMNIKYRPELIQIIKNIEGFSIGSFERSNEPQEVSSMEWGTKTAIEEMGSVPDIIYDTGGIGKEPMIRILGFDPQDVLNKLRKIIEGSAKTSS